MIVYVYLCICKVCTASTIRGCMISYLFTNIWNHVSTRYDGDNCIYMSCSTIIGSIHVLCLYVQYMWMFPQMGGYHYILHFENLKLDCQKPSSYRSPPIYGHPPYQCIIFITNTVIV